VSLGPEAFARKNDRLEAAADPLDDVIVRPYQRIGGGILEGHHRDIGGTDAGDICGTLALALQMASSTIIAQVLDDDASVERPNDLWRAVSWRKKEPAFFFRQAEAGRFEVADA
jgi:hypothetical protein